MLQINVALGDGDIRELHPYDVFQLVAGTSTGGLIALMLGKMGMTVSQCITQYKELSKIIFGKKHVRARITRGLAPAVSLPCFIQTTAIIHVDVFIVTRFPNYLLEESPCRSPSLSENCNADSAIRSIQANDCRSASGDCFTTINSPKIY